MPITAAVQRRVRVIKQLIADSLYQVDERAVADAILARAQVHQTIPDISFRATGRGPQVRSFRRDPAARSFRLAGTPRLRVHHHH
jgi:hypothetical protein